MKRNSTNCLVFKTSFFTVYPSLFPADVPLSNYQKNYMRSVFRSAMYIAEFHLNRRTISNERRKKNRIETFCYFSLPPSFLNINMFSFNAIQIFEKRHALYFFTNYFFKKIDLHCYRSEVSIDCTTCQCVCVLVQRYFILT